MLQGRPSATAQGAAMHRAAHQLLDDPKIFTDPLALRIIGEDAERALRSGKAPHVHTRSAPMRAHIAVRSRFTEDCLAEAVARGVDQYVVLGAGLDTFAYRSALGKLRVFEVDHPATQGWKRERLQALGIAVPEGLRYAPVDFERETLADGLARAGFDFAAPAFFAWLGVVPYLTRDAVMATLTFIAKKLKPESEIVFDYPATSRGMSWGERAAALMLAARVAAAGEPFRSFFVPEELCEALRAIGFSRVDDRDAEKLNALYFAGRSDGFRLRGRAHIMRARV
jgi:methyltransferase (TIGR00027 family)